MSGLLRRAGISSFSGLRVLEVGCGRGSTMRQLLEYGATPDLLVGIDLIEEHVAETRRLGPHMKTVCASASQLPLADSSFDCVVQFMLFSSILSDELRRRVAAEITRVLVPGGIFLWYDTRYDNPANPDIRGVSKKQIRQLFPSFMIRSRRVILATPLARALARFGPAVYHTFAQTRLFSTHTMCLMRKE